MSTRIALVVSVMLTLAMPAVANAALPTTHNTLIVPGKSIGGAKLGGSSAEATAAWGKGGSCDSYLGGCSYNSKAGRASISWPGLCCAGPQVVNVVVISVLILGKPKLNFNTPLTRFKTSKGIGIGSTLKQLLHAYPHMKKRAFRAFNGGNGGGTYSLAGPGEDSTQFDVRQGRIDTVDVQSFPPFT